MAGEFHKSVQVRRLQYIPLGIKYMKCGQMMDGTLHFFSKVGFSERKPLEESKGSNYRLHCKDLFEDNLSASDVTYRIVNNAKVPGVAR